MNHKKKNEAQMSVAQRREMLIELSKRRDWKYRKAKENFKRPAFYGAAKPGQQNARQEAARQQDTPQ